MAFTATLPQYTNMHQTGTSSPSSLHEKEKILGRFGNGSLMRHQFPSAIVDEDYSFDSSSVNSKQHPPTTITTSSSVRDRMITQSSLVRVPRSASSYDLAAFLRSTGPPSTYQPSIRSAHPERPTLASRLFKRGYKRRRDDAPKLLDEGGLLLPDLTHRTDMVEQKVSLAGKRYLAVLTQYQPRSTDVQQPLADEKPDLKERRVSSVSDEHLAEDITIANRYDKWYYDEGRTSPVSPLSSHKNSMELAPPPEPAVGGSRPELAEQAQNANSHSIATHDAAALNILPEEHQSDVLAEEPAENASEVGMARVTSHRLARKPVTPMPPLALPKEEFPVRLPRLDRDDIKHPSPRRFHSHPVLQRSSDVVAGAIQPRSDTESPATPPAKSPLRLGRETRGAERSTDAIVDASPKTAPVIDLTERLPSIVPSVTTNCSGPMSKHVSATPVQHALYPASRKEREERIRARKLRDRPQSIVRNTIDSLVSGSPDSPRRLRKSRIQINAEQDAANKTRKRRAVLRTSDDVDDTLLRDLAPAAEITSSKRPTNPSTPVMSDLKPAPLSSTTSSPEKEDTSAHTSPARTSSEFVENKVCLHSMVLVAEEMPIPKTKSPFRPAKIVVAKERVYTPRPRSASMPKPASTTRRSRNSLTLPTRVLTPEMPKEDNEAPPLPSPPPNRALPPTPPASGSERMRKKSKIPSPPGKHDTASMPKARQHLASPLSQSASCHDCAWKTIAEQLEKRTNLLEAALLAMLKTNGASNSPLSSLMNNNNNNNENGDSVASTAPPAAAAATSTTAASVPSPTRVNRLDEISSHSHGHGHSASNSNGSALEVFLSTRRGSKTEILLQ